jgi:putative flippase GtrA
MPDEWPMRTLPEPEPGAAQQLQQQAPAVPPRGGPLTRLRALAIRHRTRLIKFLVIGAVVFILQFVMQAFLVQVWHIGPVVSYTALAIFCIQLNFLLNRRFTWGDRRISIWLACYRFNAQKAVSTAINFALYAGLVRLGMNYLVADALTIGFFAIVNYALGDIWAFAPGRPSGSPR